jgi:hypothetical protein
MSAVTVDTPSSWKFPFGVWIVAVYGTPVKAAVAPVPVPESQEIVPDTPPEPGVPDLLPVIVVVPEVIVNVALKLGDGG